MKKTNNNGYKLPTEANELIAKTLIDRRLSEGYIVFNEQQKVLDRKEYLEEWEWYICKR